MKRLAKLGTFALVTVLLFSFTPPKQNWSRLGTKKVNFGIEKDVIIVGANDGKFTKLKFVVKGAPVNMRKATVHFGNGTQQNLALKHNFSKNSASRTIDLAGNRRVIKKIVLWHDTKNRASKRATVTVFGRK